MKGRLNEVVSLAEGDAGWLDKAAQYFEDYASRLRDDEKAKWQLLAEVYRERAKITQSAAGKVGQNLGDPSDLH